MQTGGAGAETAPGELLYTRTHWSVTIAVPEHSESQTEHSPHHGNQQSGHRGWKDIMTQSLSGIGSQPTTRPSNLFSALSGFPCGSPDGS